MRIKFCFDKIFLLLIVLFLFRCEMDHGLEPIRSHIQGTITYRGEWPVVAEEVRIVAATKFPPTGIEDLIIGESIPLTGDRYDYNFYLEPGTYKLVGVAWREKNSTWAITSICGLYYSGSDSLIPGEVTLQSDTSVARNINIFVNRETAHRVTNSRIVGNIYFEGTWPPSVIDVRVFAATKFSLFPSVQLPTLLDISFSDGIPVGSDTATYVIDAFPATYVATLVLMFKENEPFSMNSIVALDMTPYTVSEDSTIQGPDFQIKF